MSRYPWVERANNVFRAILVVQLLAALGLGVYAGSFVITALLGGFILAVPMFLLASRPHDPSTRHTVGVATQMFTALHIHLSTGLAEVHFEVFTLLAFLSWYRDWRIFVSSVAFIAVHHIGFFVLQLQGVGVFIFEQNHLFVYILLLHAFFAIAEGGVLGVMANQNREEALESLKLRTGVKTVLSDSGNIALDKGCALDTKRKSMLGRLLWTFRETLVNIVQTNTMVTGSLKILNEAKDDVKQTTQKSVSEVAMIATSMEEMTTSIDDVAKRTTEVGNASSEALVSTEEAKKIINGSGDDVAALQEQLDLMANIVASLDEKTQDIADVMTSIEAVAEQTNLLALNAAIEAARAGEQGRGFAVVADEVRSLAGNTKNSTDTIKAVIESLVKESQSAVNIIARCVKLSGKSVESSSGARETMDKLVASINTVTANITSVASAAEEQVATAQEISRITVHLNELARQNEKAVERSTSALGSLNHAISISEEELKTFNV